MGCAGNAEKPNMRKLQIRMFFITYTGYAMFHIARKSFSSIKNEMGREEWMLSNYYSQDNQSQMYGFMDMIFMACYAMGLYISGIIGDRYDLRKFISIGMGTTALVLIIFGLAGFLRVHSFTFFACLWAVNGLVQSCGWPSNVAVMLVFKVLFQSCMYISLPFL